ncbi:MAG: 3-methyladenine DNA glycosylase [Balneolaceae bacterium]
MLNTITDELVAERVLPASEWTQRAAAHAAALDKILDPYLKKRSRREKDPVLDFLFEYYSFRPAHLRRWSPGIGYALELDEEHSLPPFSELQISDGIAALDPTLFPANRERALQFYYRVLTASAERRPLFGCFGMHEWAMVYKAGDVRHDQIPLRLPPAEIAKVVESRPLLCTHFDAFRFFTEDARPLNRHALSREAMPGMEQPGCVHTNMDLYKLAYKYYPWVDGDLLRDAFLNALEARKIDMMASPYDATAFGLTPIKIETEAGRLEYAERQHAIYEQSMPLRHRLITAYETIAQKTGITLSAGQTG